MLICGACTRADSGGGGDDSGDNSRRWTYAGLADVAENDHYLVDAAEKTITTTSRLQRSGCGVRKKMVLLLNTKGFSGEHFLTKEV